MSNLYDAVEEIVIEMENEKNKEIKSYAKMLRIALKAAGKEAPKDDSFERQMLLAQTSPAAMNRMMIEKAKAEFAGKGDKKEIDKRIKVEEEYMGDMRVCLDGPEATNYSPVDPSMPIGAYCMVTGHRYKLEPTGLRFAPLPGQEVVSGIITEVSNPIKMPQCKGL